MTGTRHQSSAAGVAKVLAVVVLLAGIGGIVGHLVSLPEAPTVYVTQTLVLLGSLVVIASTLLWVAGAMIEHFARVDVAVASIPVPLGAGEATIDGPTRAQLDDIARLNRLEGTTRWVPCPSCHGPMGVDSDVCTECGYVVAQVDPAR